MGFIDPSQVKRRELAPGVFLRSMWGERVMMTMVEIGPNAVVPAHTHPHEQMGLVLVGEFDFIIGGERKRVKPGDAYLIPSGVEHAVYAQEGWSLALDVFSPPREEYKQ